MMAVKNLRSEETKNFLRICMLVYDAIPDLLTDLLKSQLPASGFSAVLTSKESKIRSALMKYQRDILYPSGVTGGVYQGSVEDLHLDISILCPLLRIIGDIPLPPKKKDQDKLLDEADRSLSANIYRIRKQRNELAHAGRAFLSDGDFQAQCGIIRQSVEDIQNTIKPTTSRFVAEVDNILNCEMDHRMTNTYIEELLVKIQADMSTVMEDVGVLKETLDTMAADSRQVRDELSKVKEVVKTLEHDSSTMKEDVSASKVKISSINDQLNNLSTGTNHIKDPVRLTEQDLQRLASCFGSGWEMFVGQLGVGSEMVDQKKMENSTHVPSQVYSCLLVWFRKCPRPTITFFDQTLRNNLELCSVNMDKYETMKREIENR